MTYEYKSHIYLAEAVLYSSKISSNHVNVVLPYICD